MENKLKDAFNAITMPQECADNIKMAMKKKNKQIQVIRKIRYAAVAACLAVPIIICTIPTVADAIENATDFILQKTDEPETTVATTEPTSNEQFSYNDGHFNMESDTGYASGSVLCSPPDFLLEQNGRLYFVENGDNIDITDVISMERPFTYTYTENLIMYQIIIGGEFTPETQLKGVGYVVTIYQVILDGETAANRYRGGYAGGHLDKEGEEYPWVLVGVEELGMNYLR